MRPPVKMSRSDRLGSFPPFVHRFVHRRMHYEEVSGWGSSVQQTTDGGFIVTGYDGDVDVDSVMFLLKTDSQGNEQWRKTFGDGYGLSVQQTVDGGFIVSGFDDNDDVVFLFKTDKLGNI